MIDSEVQGWCIIASITNKSQDLKHNDWIGNRIQNANVIILSLIGIFFVKGWKVCFKSS